MAAIIFENPKTGKREWITWRNVLAAFLLGPIAMLLERFWVAFLIWFIVALMSFTFLGSAASVVMLIYLFVYPCFVTRMLRDRYLRHGWVEVKYGKSVIKKCPQCAEIVKSEATVCRFCGHDFSTPPA